MKILFIDFLLPHLIKDDGKSVGGWTVQLSSWLKGIEYVGHQAGVLTFKGASDYVGSKVYFDILDTYDPKKGLKILKYFYYYIPTLLSRARQYKPDVIIQAPASLYTGVMAFIASRISVPFVYRVANDMDVDGRYKQRLRKYEQLAFRYGRYKAHLILCQNQYQLDCLKKIYPNKPMHILHNPFDSQNRLINLKSRWDRSYFAWIGLFGYQKNMSLLYSIAKRLPDVKFKIAGMPLINVDEGTVVAINNLKQLNNVDFVGYLNRAKLMEFQAQAIGLLMTSHYEGFSNTILEALVSGTPVVAPERVDPDNIITRNNLGFTSNNDEDLHLLVYQLNKMESGKYEDLSKRCRSYVTTHHSPKNKAKELIDLLKPLTESFNKTTIKFLVSL
jgi:glycosyltransferase involved in cell wall biosynthesis